MPSTGFDWDEYNIGHIAEHNVRPSEFEEVMRNDPIFQFQEERNGEQRILGLGHTNALRILFVVWTPRGTLMRPVTVFDPPGHIRNKYLTLFEQE